MELLIALRISLPLAIAATLLLLPFAFTLAWFISRLDGRWRPLLLAAVGLPLVASPAVLGSLLAPLAAPSSEPALAVSSLSLETDLLASAPLTLPVELLALLIACLPVVTLPLYRGLRRLGRGPLEAIATLGIGPLRRFQLVLLPALFQPLLASMLLGVLYGCGMFGSLLVIGSQDPLAPTTYGAYLYHKGLVSGFGQILGLAWPMAAASYLSLLFALWPERGERSL